MKIVAVLAAFFAQEPVAQGPSESMRAAHQALLEKLHVEEAWDHTRGDPQVLIGVIDNGFDYYHPSLKGRVAPGYYYPGGYHAEFYENLAHGTLVAGLIVADEKDGIGGLAPDCRILTASQGTIEHVLLRLQKGVEPGKLTEVIAAHRDEVMKFGEEWTRYQVSGAADAVRYLVDHGVRVINLSGLLLKSLCPAQDAWERLEAACAHAAAHDVILVLAAGNSAQRSTDYPRGDSVLIVGGILADDRRWQQSVEYGGATIQQGSHFGPRLDVMAPIENIVTCEPHERRFYATDDGPFGETRVEFSGLHQLRPIGGTSSAAPIVTALVALVRSARPDLDAATVIDLIQRGCDDLGEPGRDDDTGWGRVDFGKTLELALDA